LLLLLLLLLLCLQLSKPSGLPEGAATAPQLCWRVLLAAKSASSTFAWVDGIWQQAFAPARLQPLALKEHSASKRTTQI
jgi:hypothetical protein